jgi:hypothetical protein
MKVYHRVHKSPPLEAILSHMSLSQLQLMMMMMMMMTMIIIIIIINVFILSNESRDSSVGIALCYGLDDQGSRVRFPAGTGIFYFNTASRTALRPTQPPIQGVLGSPSLGVKRPGREAAHSPSSSVEVKE